jgi:hypothetical protein
MNLTLNTTIILTFAALMTVGGYWWRFDAPIWGAF